MVVAQSKYSRTVVESQSNLICNHRIGCHHNSCIFLARNSTEARRKFNQDRHSGAARYAGGRDVTTGLYVGVRQPLGGRRVCTAGA